MTTATLVSGNRTMETAGRPRRSLEELVDRLMAALFKEVQPATARTATPTATEPQSVVRSVHEARRLRQAGDLAGALAVLGGVDTGRAERHEARWAFAEWTQLVKRRFGDRDALVYSQGAGQGRRGGASGRRRRDAGGRRGPGDALAARQGRLGAQPAGDEALGECLPSAPTGDWPGAGVAQATVDDP